MSKSQYLQAKTKKFESHWDVVKIINGGEAVRLINIINN